MNNTFVNAINHQTTRTQNDMRAFQSTADNCTDLFFKVGASRGQNIRPVFNAAMAENAELALRIMQWARDVRGGAGERELFRQVLLDLEISNPDWVHLMMDNIPEIGRWDDLLIFKSNFLKRIAFGLIRSALEERNGLCAKWMPRKGQVAVELRNFLGWTPKRYRKTLVELTNVVETPMCANRWAEIDYEKVPSLASARYKKAFERHDVTQQFAEYAQAAAKGEAKINAGAVFPYDVLKTLFSNYRIKQPTSSTEANHIRAQWDALPNLIGGASLFPMIDVSQSMYNSACCSISPLLGAISLGLYCASKNEGVFKDAFLTFSGDPIIQIAQGDIISKVSQVARANWGFNTNIVYAFGELLHMAVQNHVKKADMPETLVIFSDMQFDRCASFDDNAMQSIERQYFNAGYTIPKIVFWNLDAHDNVPVKFNQQGVALVSGFSPFIMQAVLDSDLEQFTPRNVMLKTVMIDRYRL